MLRQMAQTKPVAGAAVFPICSPFALVMERMCALVQALGANGRPQASRAWAAVVSALAP
jgi:hypothetical protein